MLFRHIRLQRWIPISNLGALRHYTLPHDIKHIPSSLRSKKNISHNDDGYDLNLKYIADTLDNDPSLKDFYDENTLNQIKSLKNGNKDLEFHNDPYDLSNIPIYSPNDSNSKQQLDSFSNNNPISDSFIPNNTPMTEPKTMSTADFIKMMSSDPSNPLEIENDSNIPSTDDYLTNIFQKNHIDKNLNQSLNIPKPSKIIDFLNKDDIPNFNTLPNLMNLSEIVKTDLPLILISKLTDPRLNLSIEKYIYDNYPDPRLSINKFAKRLFLYKNSNCIVLGKNQNIFREINLRLASTYSIPILRRFSGGGTVVHDLGNFNFSFMCSKDDFTRTTFTNEIINKWNIYYNTYKPENTFELDINLKGDMIRKSDEKKISGSAFQISKGKSLHHGTMLLNSDLNTLGKLLKIDNERLSSITDHATNSIPSPITNTNINHDLFIDLCINSFVDKFGVPTNLNSKILKLNYNNLELLKNNNNNLESQVFKIDDLTQLPNEVIDTYNQLKDWNWIFGKSPRFQMAFKVDHETIDLKFDVNQGRIISLEYDNLNDDDGEGDEGNDKRLQNLIDALSTKEIVVNFSGKSVGQYIADPILKREIAWKIDQCIDFDRIGIVE